jgi:GAF domain-containing protein
VSGSARRRRTGSRRTPRAPQRVQSRCGRSPDANDPRWRDFRDLALAYGLRACWSTPIHGSDGTVVGTFANYYKVVVRDPSPVDLELTDRITRAAAIAIENARRP